MMFVENLAKLELGSSPISHGMKHSKYRVSVSKSVFNWYLSGHVQPE